MNFRRVELDGGVSRFSNCRVSIIKKEGIYFSKYFATIYISTKAEFKIYFVIENEVPCFLRVKY